MARKYPRLIVAGLSGDSGKTLTCLSLVAALRRKRFSVSVFKKGPDYIDSAWLSWASGVDSRNLDTYLIGSDDIIDTFVTCARSSDFAIIEGNRGLFDGKDSSGTHSTAELATLLQAPVVLVVNTAKATRTIAAVINGCRAFDPDLNLAGVILNNVAGARHESVITETIGRYCSLPILGVLPRLDTESVLIPNRHLGLIPPAEYGLGQSHRNTLADIAEKNLDIETLIELARSAEALPGPNAVPVAGLPAKVKIGYFRDSVFTFYYPENLEALAAAGAELLAISSLEDSSLPEIDALYIGGGFPETHADRLSENQMMMKSVRAAATGGLPVYAECGGLMYLSRSVTLDTNRYPMSGVFPIDLRMESKPVGHGYTLVRVDRVNPFYEIGTEIRGHEFHYSGSTTTIKQDQCCLKVEKGVGLGNGRDGLVVNNTLGCYTHIHARGVKSWAVSMVAGAESFRSGATRLRKAV